MLQGDLVKVFDIGESLQKFLSRLQYYKAGGLYFLQQEDRN